MTINVLLVEDDLDLAATVIDYFELESIQCDHAANGVHGLSLIEQNSYQVLILDLNLPRMDGLSLCQKVREQGNDTPVLMLTARDTLQDKLTGFEVGTDDYLVKPFEIEELMMRVLALSKRRSGQQTQLNVDQLNFDIKHQSATYDNTPIKLTPITAKLLEKLMREYNKPVKRELLVQAVWGDEQPDSNSLKVHIHHLRKQLKAVNAELAISSSAGLGFILSQPALSQTVSPQAKDS